MKMWSGRFQRPLDPGFERWQRSFPFDRRLLPQELEAGKAYARGLKKAGILSAAELQSILQGLDAIAQQAARDPGFLEGENVEEIEDVHHFVEQRLVELAGETGYKLHSGRSRNEQIATDLRLYARENIERIQRLLLDWVETLLQRAAQAGTAAMPSYTHLQPAEPVLVAHWLLAYVEMFLRDGERLAGCRARLNQCPLGSGAVAGAPLALDRDALAAELGFDAPTANSMDATSDRDFAIELVQHLALLASHLSRWAEEMIVFSSREFGFLELPESHSTGSSAMPQKKNPDAPELVRGKSARILGDAVALLVVTKGLPLAYNKDLQETQEPLFDAVTTAGEILEIARGFMEHLTFNFERMQAAAEAGFTNAMAAAAYLARRGVPFRRAHQQVARAVEICMEKYKETEKGQDKAKDKDKDKDKDKGKAKEKGCELHQLPLEELRAISDRFDEDFYSEMRLESVLAAHDVPGGTAPARVQEALAQAQKQVALLRGIHEVADAR